MATKVTHFLYLLTTPLHKHPQNESYKRKHEGAEEEINSAAGTTLENDKKCYIYLELAVEIFGKYNMPLL
jgi:hypothetical protein